MPKGPYTISETTKIQLAANWPTSAGAGQVTFTIPNIVGSGLFNGTSQYLTVPDNAAFSFGAGDFTVEAWLYRTAAGGDRTNCVAFSQSVSSFTSNSALYLGAGSNGFSFIVSTGGTSATLQVMQTGPTIVLNTWYHVVWQRRSNVLEIYVNGVLQTVVSGSAAFSGTIYDSSLAINIASQAGGALFPGYISNARIVKGTAVYTGTFTVPIAPLTATQTAGTNIAAVTGTSTSLLTCQSNGFLDNSTNLFTITAVGSPSITTFKPFTIPNTYTWVCPVGVTSVSVVAVGGGGSGSGQTYLSSYGSSGAGGGGGALAYVNNISVTPGSSYTVVVGAGGLGITGGNTSPGIAGNSGGESSFNTSTVRAGGGAGGGAGTMSVVAVGGSGGSVLAGTGGSGGSGGTGEIGGELTAGGGGGAGGYSGAGGAGGNPYSAGSAAVGGGGGAGGGSSGTNTGGRISGSGGGGVGLLGRGTTGSATLVPSNVTYRVYGGTAGSGGTASSNIVGIEATYSQGSVPGIYGGGSGGRSITNPTRTGGNGAVRIIWPGNTRSFPVTRTADE